ncbi:hypothetical protein K9B33_22630 [Sphingobium sp. 3R8]|uniref:hypothetical protein n=1 Tax=Sphingobium sp. 3R8 TaxID=2874921 RepID=UPI001CCC3984|nr:hypothetical protein [Sphingobium sp. 3R8]MBZ9650331.1 hypothetical protein [Sphingobium sp. 3R8]
MSGESNWAGKIGESNSSDSYVDFRNKGLNHDHANEAVAAAKRQQEATQKKS